MTDKIISSDTEKQQSDTMRTSWSELGIHTYIKIAVIGVLFYYLFRFPINNIVGKWIHDSSWSHGFLIPLFSLYFLNQHKDEILNLETKPSYLGLVFLILGIAFYPINIVQLRFGVLEPIGVIATLGAIVLFLGGWRLVKYAWLPVIYLGFAVPLPERLYFKLTYPMRQLAATVANFLLNQINGVETNIHGVVIDVIRNGQAIGSLDVEEACSGMRLLMAFVALGVAMAYLHYRPIWQRLILLATTIPIAIFCNVVRVTVTGFIYTFGNKEYATGIYHDMLGMMTLPLAFGLYGAIAWFMENLFVDESEETITADVIVRKKDDNEKNKNEITS